MDYNGHSAIDIDGDKLTIKGKDGESLTVGQNKWPETDYLPEFKKGNIVLAFKDAEGNVSITLEKVEQQDFEDYLEVIKEAFPEEAYEIESEEYLFYAGQNAKGEYNTILKIIP